MNSAAIRFLVVRHAHHEHLDVDAEERAGERERRAPLAGTGLGGDLPDARFLVVEGLRDRGVRLVAAGRADALVLVVDAGRASAAPVSRRRARKSGVGRHCRYTSRTGSGISISRSVETSCMMSDIGNSGARSSGPTGFIVPGCSTGGGGDGRSATRLYQTFGMRVSSSRYLTLSLMLVLDSEWCSAQAPQTVRRTARRRKVRGM